jgi:hypothetical protein
MSGEKKIIKINPALFTIGKSGSGKNKTEKKRPIIAPLIQPNSLKNELLRRIKKHKNKEIEKIQEQDKKNRKGVENVDIGKYTDEFNESMDYLNILSSEKKLSAPTFQKGGDQYIPVELDLPEDLKERAISPARFIANNEPKWRETPSMELKYKVDNDVPYGCLKNGYKPTFKTLRNHSPIQNTVRISNPPIQAPLQRQTQIKPPIQIQTPLIRNDVSEREKRMKVLKDTIQKKKSEMVVMSPADPTPTNTAPILFSPPQIQIQPRQIEETKDDAEEPIHNLIKKTIRRKYTVGKSKKNNTVGILIKDKNTRKNILNAQKELRKKNINDVKTYLRKHGLLKVGSTAPNDVVRKMYEATMMTGDIHNNNKDVLLHNFMKEGDVV